MKATLANVARHQDQPRRHDTTHPYRGCRVSPMVMFGPDTVEVHSGDNVSVVTLWFKIETTVSTIPNGFQTTYLSYLNGTNTMDVDRLRFL